MVEPLPLDAVGAAPVDRLAARVLLLDAAERVLLFLGQDPTSPSRGTWWITPGGGLDPGESAAQGAARELREETGLDLPAAALGDPVHARIAEFVFDGQAYRQSEQFFLARVDAHEVDTAGFTALEVASVLRHRWWEPAALKGTDDVVYPADLLAVLARAAGGAWC
ncbi:MAG: hydrolase [Frankiales bacterium]|nr:hydrolase [Frankiales bacterium]